MAVNLLSLAGALGRTLHNKPTSTKRNNSYAPGTSYGNKIPGTNMRKGAGLKNLASKGRRGDTKIRKVKGRTSHVNATEANVIDSLGPLGEAWVEKIGSGTINPQTGLKEYGTWRPSQGKWGIFGQTKKSKARDRAKTNAASRHKIFEDFRREYEQENIAGIWTPDEDVDDTDKIKSGGYASGLNPEFEKFVTEKSGLITTAADAAAAKEKAMEGMNKVGFGNFSEEQIAAAGTGAGEKQTESNSNDINKYLDPYDPRKQDELTADYTRNLDKLGLQEDKAFTQDIQNQKATGSALSSGLFGMLTQAQDTTAQKGFAGSGDFAADFQKKTAIEEAERAVNAGQTDREMTLEGQKIDTEQAVADLASGTADLQEDYNQEFWNNMVSWDSAINA